MAAPSPGPAAGPATGARVDEDAAYYQSIEEFFVSRRGDPLFLSNADWTLIRKWHRGGIPLRIVLRGIADALDSHAHSWGRTRKVGSLAYCSTEVDAARQRWQRALAMDDEQASEAVTFLRDYADRLDATSLGPSATPLARRLAAELRQRAVAVDADGTEEWLAGCESALLKALEKDGGGAALTVLRAEVDADLESYRDRLPARVLAQIRDGAIARRILGAHGLGRLSLLQL